MKIMIVGGTGLLGHEAAKVALERGHEVASLAIPDVPMDGWYPKQIKTLEGDVFELSQAELAKILQGYDAMIYAVGPDDRITPAEPAYEFFKRRLVDHAAKVFRAARDAGIKKASLCSSYFLYFDRKFPEKKLAEIHPYIRVRKEQAELILREAAEARGGLPKLDVCVMELPYIFGTCPHRQPLWRAVFLDNFVNGKKTIMFPKGGSVMTTTRHVGEALVGAIEYGKGGKSYAIGDENHDFNWMLNNMLIGIQGKPRKIWNPPRRLCAMGANMMAKSDQKKGLYHGLDFKHVMLDIQTDYFYYPEEEIAATYAELHIGRGGVEEAIIETGKACYAPGEFR